MSGVTTQPVQFHKHAPPLHIGLIGAQVTLLVTNSLTACSSNRVVCNTGGEAGYMSEFSNVFIKIECSETRLQAPSVFFFGQLRPQASGPAS